MSHDTFMNPMAPPGYEDDRNHNSKKLSNADFRKLLMTPRGTPGSAASSLGSTNLGSTRAHHSGAHVHQRIDITSGAESNAEKRRKKKQFYAKLKKDEDDVLAELSKKYRDRAQERREEIKVKGEDEEQNLISGYRAVAPDLKSGMDQAERRRQLIQESKFLGGDMEHTHLVKGLDYALLQKVRSEIHAHERAVDDELEKVADVKPAGLVVEAVKPIESEPEFKTKMGRNIHRLLIESAMPERNELFVPGRMAYVIDLEDDTAESDIPTTTVRSKADCPNIESQATLSTNDIVINKLTQILAYLRQGGARAGKKMKKKDRQRYEDMKGRTYDDPIFPDIGHYEPTLARDKEKKRAAMSYFDKPVSELEEEERRKEKEIHESYDWKNIKGQKELVDAASTGDPKDPAEAQKQKQILSRLDTVGYAECYPGLEEMNDAIEDSDDEADYTKMDMGNKKGPIGRWDFDTQEEYSNYMSQKEALPKAAFQYGVKMADGRKTRRIPRNEKNEKAELDREWKKIQNILDKRKSERGGGGSSEKKAKYS